MTAPTHITFAAFIYLLLLTTTGVALSIVNTLVVVIASILPDVDTGASIVGRSLPFISRRIERRFGHRTITHSIPFITALGLLLLPLVWINMDLYACLIIGYATHPFLDSMTINGVKLFYPFSAAKCVFPLEVNNPHRYRVQTGSKMDRTLCILFLVACVPTFLIAHQGYQRFIRYAQRNIESAVRDYNEASQTHFVKAEISGHNLLTKERIHGTFQVVGSLNDHTLLFRGPDGQLHTLGKQYLADYVAEEVVCHPDVPSHAIVTSIDMANQPLSQLSTYLDAQNENHLFGVLSSNDDFALPQETREFTPISGTPTNLKLHFASYEDIRKLHLENIYINKGILTVRTMVSDARAATVQVPKPKQEEPSGLSSFSTVSFEVDSKTDVELLKSVGDTVRVSEVLARKIARTFYAEQIELNMKKIEALDRGLTAKLHQLQQRISKEQKIVSNDSVKLHHASDQLLSGYITQQMVSPLRNKVSLGRGNINSLMLASRSLEDKTNLQVIKLRNQNSELHSKERLAGRHSTILSSVTGVIVDVRRISSEKKQRVTFIIRRAVN